MSTITLQQLNTFLALLAESDPVSPGIPTPPSTSGWNGWLRPGEYIVEGDFRIGTFQWYPKGLTEVQINMKFNWTSPDLWGVSLDHPEEVLRASTFLERKIALERQHDGHFDTVRDQKVRHVSHVPGPGDFLMSNAIVFQASQGMDFWFCKDGTRYGFMLVVKGVNSLHDEDLRRQIGETNHSRFLLD